MSIRPVERGRLRVRQRKELEPRCEGLLKWLVNCSLLHVNHRHFAWEIIPLGYMSISISLSCLRLGDEFLWISC